MEFAQLQAKYESLQLVLTEKDNSIERLENDLKKADLDKEDLKAVYNNYFLQVQTLINQKAIGTGSTKAREESKTAARKEAQVYSSVVNDYEPASKEKPDIEPENKPEVKQEEKTKNTLDIVCIECGETFTAARSTRLFCSGKCKTAYYRKKENMEE